MNDTKRLLGEKLLPVAGSRYFHARNPNSWIVWDRHKNELVAEYPRAAKGARQAEERAADLNRQVDARNA
jgi:hypothetical protein